jgi:hypothetical protein
MKQRGLSTECVEAVLEFGQEFFRKGGCVYLVTKKIANKMYNLGCDRHLVEKVEGTYVVVANGFVLTVAHKTTNFKY